MTVRVLVGDARAALRTLDAESVDCVVTSPPYWNLRDYGHPEQLGQEETLDGYVRNLVDVFGEVWRVLKPQGTVFLNIGDCYAGSGKGLNADGKHCATGDTKQATNQGTIRNTGRKTPVGNTLKPKDLALVPARTAIALQDDGWWVRSEIVWAKCLSGGTSLYAKTQKGVGVHPLKDLARLDPETVSLWNGERWTKVTAWSRTPRPARPLEIVLRSGERIGCTPEHRWPTHRGLVEARDLVVGDVLRGCALPNEGGAPKWLRPALWFAGLYLAEGSMSGDTIQISLHAKEDRYWRRIQSVCAYYGAKSRRYLYGNEAHITIDRAHGLRAVLRTVLAGRTSKDKRLSGQVWEWNANDLRYILLGYLNGDASWEPDNRRWRLGFTRNYGLERDLRTLAARLGARLTLKPTVTRARGKEYKSFKGEWRFEGKRFHHNEKERFEVVEVRRSKGRVFYDVTVEDEPHLFALASGVLTHNCNPMPESVKDRPSTAHEHIWMLTKSARHYYNNGEGQVEATRRTMDQLEIDHRSALSGKVRDNKYGRNPGYDAMREQAARVPVSDETVRRGERAAHEFGKAGNGRNDERRPYKPTGPNGFARRGREHRDGPPKQDGAGNRTYEGFNARWNGNEHGPTRRLRNYEDAPLEVWRLSPAQFSGAHFATFPATLVERCLAVGCPAGGTVLDPFAGAGTVGLVADRLGYEAVLCELNPDYAAMSVERIQAEAPLTADVRVEAVQEALL